MCVTVERCVNVKTAVAHTTDVTFLQPGKIIPQFYGTKKQVDFPVLSVNIFVI